MKVYEDIPNTNQESIFGAEWTCQQKEREAKWPIIDFVVIRVSTIPRKVR